MTPSPNTILLKVRQHLGYDEGRVLTGKTITPGMLIEMASGGDWQPHSMTGNTGVSAWAVENDFLGDVRSPVTIDTDYAAGDLVRFHRALPDDEIYAWLADSVSVAVGDELSSNGDGTLRKATVGAFVFAEAMEAVSTVGGATAAARIAVRTMTGYYSSQGTTTTTTTTTTTGA